MLQYRNHFYFVGAMSPLEKKLQKENQSLEATKNTLSSRNETLAAEVLALKKQLEEKEATEEPKTEPKPKKRKKKKVCCSFSQQLLSLGKEVWKEEKTNSFS